MNNVNFNVRLSAVNSLDPKVLAVATDSDSFSMPNPEADDAGWSYSGQRNWIVIEIARLAAAAEEVL
jgi:hypothetical protein